MCLTTLFSVVDSLVGHSQAHVGAGVDASPRRRRRLGRGVSRGEHLDPAGPELPEDAAVAKDEEGHRDQGGADNVVDRGPLLVADHLQCHIVQLEKNKWRKKVM